MSDFMGFLGSVLSHWVALMSGGFSLVLAVIGQNRAWAKAATRVFWVFAAMAIFFGCFQSRQDERRNAAVLTQEKAHLTGENNTCNFEKLLKEKDIESLMSLRATDANMVAGNRLVMDAQQQNVSRQSTQIGQCLVDEGKMNPAIRIKYKVLLIPLNDPSDIPPGAPAVPKQSVWSFMMLIQVNRRQYPHGTLSCSEDFSIATPPRISANINGPQIINWQSPQRLDGHSYLLEVQSSEAWQDGNPIHFLVQSHDAFLTDAPCTFEPSL